MNVILTDRAKKQLKKLPSSIKKKVERQMIVLKDNQYHPSLHFHKMMNSLYYEGRIDYQYRFVGSFVDGDFCVLSLGPHDEGLGKR